MDVGQPRSRARIPFLAVLFLSAATILFGTPPLLDSGLAVHRLTLDEARRAYPVKVRLIVLADLNTWHGIFAADSTSGIFVQTDFTREGLVAGTLIDVEGVSRAGDFAPIIDAKSFRIVGQAPLPPARRVSVEHLSTGKEDGQWVEIEDTVRTAVMRSSFATLIVGYGWSRIEVTSTSGTLDEARQYIGARVRVVGAAGPVFNQKRQVIGVNMYTPGFKQGVTVLSRLDPFTLPVRPLKKLREYSPVMTFDDPVHTQGVISAIWPGKAVFITDGKQGVGLPTSQELPLRVGDRVDVAGFPSLGETIHSLQDPIFRRLGRAANTAEAHRVTMEQAWKGEVEADLVRIEGRLVARQWSASHYTLLMEAPMEGSNRVFSAMLPSADRIPAFEALGEDALWNSPASAFRRMWKRSSTSACRAVFRFCCAKQSTSRC